MQVKNFMQINLSLISVYCAYMGMAYFKLPDLHGGLAFKSTIHHDNEKACMKLKLVNMR